MAAPCSLLLNTLARGRGGILGFRVTSGGLGGVSKGAGAGGAGARAGAGEWGLSSEGACRSGWAGGLSGWAGGLSGCGGGRGGSLDWCNPRRDSLRWKLPGPLLSPLPQERRKHKGLTSSIL